MAKRKLHVIENDRIVLRLLEYADLPLTLSWRNRDEIRKWFLNTAIIPIDDHYAWFERYQELDNDFVFLILAKEIQNIPVGQISLYAIDWKMKTAEFGRLMIGEPRAQGKGIAKNATQLLLSYSRDVLGLDKIFLEVKEKNKVAISIYKSSGFVERDNKDGLIIMDVRL